MIFTNRLDNINKVLNRIYLSNKNITRLVISGDHADYNYETWAKTGELVEVTNNIRTVNTVNIVVGLLTSGVVKMGFIPKI